jgi:hypothetical protein
VRGSEHDWGFFVWLVPGFLIVFGFVAGFSIGMPFLLLGIGLLLYLQIRGPGWPADLGLLAGVGCAGLLFAAIAEISGDYSPMPWAPIGFVLVAVSAATFWWLRCRPALRQPE